MSTVSIIKESVLNIQDSGVPYFEYGTWAEVSEILISMNKSPIRQKQKYPLVFLLSETMRNYDLDPESEIVTADADIYICNVAAKNKRSIWREDNEFPLLRTIRNNFLESLKQNVDDILSINPFDELPYDNTLFNKLDIELNIIHLGLSFEHDLKDCEI